MATVGKRGAKARGPGQRITGNDARRVGGRLRRRQDVRAATNRADRRVQVRGDSAQTPQSTASHASLVSTSTTTNAIYAAETSGLHRRMESSDIKLRPSERQTLQYVAEGELPLSALDWIALQRLKAS